IHDSHSPGILSACGDVSRQFSTLSTSFRSALAFSQMHQYVIDSHAVEPGCESCFATKGSDGSEQMDENVLGQVFRFSNILSHTKARRINASVVSVIKLVEHLLVTFAELLSFARAVHTLVPPSFVCPQQGVSHQ